MLLGNKNYTAIVKSSLITLVLFLQIFVTSNSWSKDSGLGRIRHCDSEGGVIGGIDYNPTTGGKDAQWVLTNPVCLTVIASNYALTKKGLNKMNVMCGTGSPSLRWFPSPLIDSIDIVKATAMCASQAVLGGAGCCSGVGVASSAMGTFMSALAIMWALAEKTYAKTHICGDGWYGPNTENFDMYREDFKGRLIPSNELMLKSGGAPPSTFNGSSTTRDIVSYCASPPSPNDRQEFCSEQLSNDKRHYREYVNGGKEYEDNPSSGHYCKDPYRYNHPQRYYLRGYEEGVYNCQRYDVEQYPNDPTTGRPWTEEGKIDDFKEAYECCKNRAENYICISHHGSAKFCKANANCTIGGITFSTQSQEDGARICAETYSLCPYNFYIGGGSDICDYYQDSPTPVVGDTEITCSTDNPIRDNNCELNEKAGKCKNYCQYMRHCVKTSKIYAYKTSDASPYFSEACINFVGDSRNTMSISQNFISASSRHFSAPIVQCFKETIENMFHNRAGHSRCSSDNVGGALNITGLCPSGFEYEKGDQVNEQSFFEKVQVTLNTTIRVALSLAIMFYGMKILTASGEIKKKDMMLLIVKIAVIMFFATGAAWKDWFFDGIYNTSNFFSEMVFKIQIPELEEHRDGCQFGRVYTSIETGDEKYDAAHSTYPEGKSYLALWDTLDCKLARYMGFGPGVEVATIAKMVVAGWLIGPIGVYFVTVLFLVAFLMISTIVRAVHIFLASSIAIILLIFISPITITCALTEKTKDIFNNWLKQLISFAVQPIILFVYLAIFISALDTSLRGDATYVGDAPAKMISCDKYCAEADGSKARDVGEDISIDDCDGEGRSVINPKSSSFECLISDSGYGRFPGLEIIGISIPFLLELFIEEPKKKMMTLIKAIIIIYFLYKFMDEVPNIASQLFGGAKLPQATLKAGDMFNKTTKLLKGAQKRGGRTGAKAAGNAKRTAAREMRPKQSQSSSDKPAG